jgi:hypothetical protein
MHPLHVYTTLIVVISLNCIKIQVLCDFVCSIQRKLPPFDNSVKVEFILQTGLFAPAVSTYKYKLEYLLQASSAFFLVINKKFDARCG